MSKYSNWYPPEIKPFYVGVYDVADRNLFNPPWFRFWDGANWKMGDSSPYDASLFQQNAVRVGKWRGLTRKPK